MTDITGKEFTTTLLIAVFVLAQPFVPVAVTEYELLLVGFTVKFPPEILNTFTPVALGLITAEFPAQMDGLFTVMVGLELTEMVLIAVLELAQPNELKPEMPTVVLFVGAKVVLPLE